MQKLTIPAGNVKSQPSFCPADILLDCLDGWQTKPGAFGLGFCWLNFFALLWLRKLRSGVVLHLVREASCPLLKEPLVFLWTPGITAPATMATLCCYFDWRDSTSSSTTTISTRKIMIISNIFKRYSAHSLLSSFTWNRYTFA